jgi:prevent-host-death family protein
MVTIGISEAKPQLGELALSAAAGEIVILTKRGRPLAKICGFQSDTDEDGANSAIDALRRFRDSLHVGAFDVAELIAEGRR